MIALAGMQSIVIGFLGFVSVAGIVALAVFMKIRDAARTESLLIELKLAGGPPEGDDDHRKRQSKWRPPATVSVIVLWLLLLIAAVVIYSLVAPPR